MFNLKSFAKFFFSDHLVIILVKNEIWKEPSIPLERHLNVIQKEIHSLKSII